MLRGMWGSRGGKSLSTAVVVGGCIADALDIVVSFDALTLTLGLTSLGIVFLRFTLTAFGTKFAREMARDFRLSGPSPG